MPRPPVIHVTDPKQWRVLLAPVRFELVEAMRSVAPCGVAELAAELGRPADALYRHVRALERAGYVTAAGFRKVGRHVEQVFDLTADDFRLAAPGSIVPTLRAVARSMDKVVRDADGAGAVEPSAAVRQFAMFYELAWLTPDQVRRMFAYVMKVKAVTDDRRHRRRPDARLFAVQVVVAPVVTAKGRTSRRNRKA